MLKDASVSVLFSEPKIPQCKVRKTPNNTSQCFSALQRAENSSIARRSARDTSDTQVSVLFSEPKIPQSCGSSGGASSDCVSVLFSEPKIPQFSVGVFILFLLSRFQCSSASRKFLNLAVQHPRTRVTPVSVLFSEPKIPQFNPFVQFA